MTRWLLSGAMLLLGFGPLAAQPPAPAGPASPEEQWQKASYQLTLVMHVDRHPLLTPVFVEELKATVRDTLQRDLAKIATVDVVDTHPLMEEILRKGWADLDKRPYAVDDKKLHFLRIGIENGQYEIQTRQVDGSTAIVSPLRKASTPDRQWVARLAALTVAQDFGMVAQVGEVTGKAVRLRLKGTGLNDPESVRVRVGQVFGLAEIRQGRDGKPQGNRIPDALLYVTDVREGECTARLFHRYEDPLKKTRQTVGFRALKLGTRQAPFQFRVVDAKTNEPLAGCGVKLYPSGFEARLTEELTTNAQGRARSKETYQNVVFVKVSLAGVEKAQVPVPLFDDQFVEFRMAGTQEVEALAAFEYRNRQWGRSLREVDLLMDQDAQQIRELQAKDERAAVEKAKEAVARQKSDIDQVRRGLEEVRDAAKGVNQQTGDAMLARAQRALDALIQKSKSFEEYIEDVTNPTPARIALKQARLQDAAFDAENAVKHYKESLKHDPSQAEVADRVKKIENAWRIKGEFHQKARDFVTSTWPALEGDEIEKRLPEAQNAFRDCERAQDFFTAYKLLKANMEHQQKLAGLREQLSSDNSEDAADRLRTLEKLLTTLQELNEKIAVYIDRVAR